MFKSDNTNTIYKFKIFTALVVLLYFLFIIFKLNELNDSALISESLIVPLIAIAYFFCVKNKDRLFTTFFVLYAISDFYSIINMFWSIPFKPDDFYYGYQWYIGTGLYILSYFALFVYIVKSLNIKQILKDYKIHVFVLTILNLYLIYVLQNIIEVNTRFKYMYTFELVYNIILVLMLSVSLLKFSYKQSKKSLYLFFGSLCITFSEIMDIAYMYIENEYLIEISATTLSLIAFYFYFKQSRILHKANKIKKLYS